MALTNIFNPDYDSFRKNIDILLDETDIKTKEQLSFLMREKGFREKRQIDFDRELQREVKYTINVEPKEKQLNLAWEYVISKSTRKQDMTYIKYRVEKYKRHQIYRVMSKEPITYKNKKYRKGQFLPKEYKE